MGIYYVSASGSDNNVGNQASPFLTIQHALDVASDEDTIYIIYGGTHYVHGPLDVHKSVHFIGRMIDTDPRPYIEIKTLDNDNAINCIMSNTTFTGLEINHVAIEGATHTFNNDPTQTGSTSYYYFADENDNSLEQITRMIIDDCKVYFYRSAIISNTDEFEFKNSELYCKFSQNVGGFSYPIIIHSMNGIVNIDNNVLTSNGFNQFQLVKSVDNVCLCDCSCIEVDMSGVINITDNNVENTRIIRAFDSFKISTITNVGTIKINIIGNHFIQTNNEIAYFSENRNFNTAYDLITIANNSFQNVSYVSHFVKIGPLNDTLDPTFSNFTITSPIVEPKFAIYSNEVKNILNIPVQPPTTSNYYYLGDKDELLIYSNNDAISLSSSLPNDISNILINYKKGVYLMCDITNVLSVSSYDTSYNMSGIYAYETDRQGVTTSVLPQLYVKFLLDVNEFVSGIDVADGYALSQLGDNTAETDDIFIYSTRNLENLTSQQLDEIKWSPSYSESTSIAFSDYIVNDSGVVMPINENERTGSIAVEVEGKSRKTDSSVGVHFTIGGIASKTYTKYDNPYSADAIFISNNPENIPSAPSFLDNDILQATTDGFMEVKETLSCSGTLSSISLTIREVNDLVHAIISDQDYNQNDTIEKVRNNVANALNGLISNNTSNISFSVNMGIYSGNDSNSNSVGPSDLSVKTWVSFI